MPDAVSDASRLIHLAKIEALQLISRLYSRVFIPPAVWREAVEESDGRPGAVGNAKSCRSGLDGERSGSKRSSRYRFAPNPG